MRAAHMQAVEKLNPGRGALPKRYAERIRTHLFDLRRIGGSNAVDIIEKICSKLSVHDRLAWNDSKRSREPWSSLVNGFVSEQLPTGLLTTLLLINNNNHSESPAGRGLERTMSPPTYLLTSATNVSKVIASMYVSRSNASPLKKELISSNCTAYVTDAFVLSIQRKFVAVPRYVVLTTVNVDIILSFIKKSRSTRLLWRSMWAVLPAPKLFQIIESSLEFFESTFEINQAD